VEVGTLYTRTVAWWLSRVDAVADDQWSDPTPCTEWTVRDLVNHVVGEDRWMVPLFSGATIAELGDRLDGDLLGDDPKAAAHSAAIAALDTAATHLAIGGMVHLSYGEEDMQEYVSQLCADHLIHGWDLAAAIGADRTMEPELVEDVAQWFRDREELYRSGGSIKARPTDSGDPQTDLLAAFGRTASWAAPR
jgi:uncharacterized protein (TIGR03086 family)